MRELKGCLGWVAASVVCLVMDGLYRIRQSFQHPTHHLGGFQPPRRSSRRKGS